MKRLPIKHIGVVLALCDRRKRASLREDLGVARYRQLGVKERFVNEEPYRICPACIKRVGDAMWMANRRRSRRLDSSTKAKP